MQKENLQVIKFASIARDSKGNCIVGGNKILCTSKDGLKFLIPKNSLSLDAKAMICPVGDELYQIQLDNLNDKANNASNIDIADESSTSATTNDIDTADESFTSATTNIDTADESSTSATTNESAIIKRNHGADSSFSWSDESTKYFLSLYRENRKLVPSRKLKTLKAMWIHIANTMTKSGYNVSPLQVENKFKTMERVYKNMVSNNKKTGRGRATCSYERYIVNTHTAQKYCSNIAEIFLCKIATLQKCCKMLLQRCCNIAATVKCPLVEILQCNIAAILQYNIAIILQCNIVAILQYNVYIIMLCNVCNFAL